MILNTVGYQIASNYLSSSFSLDEKGFRELLAENVEMVHITNGSETKVSGIDKVMDVYKKYFFDVTTNIDVQEITILTNDLEPQFICKVSETKTYGDNQFFKTEIQDHTKLKIVKEKEVWKIDKIISDVTKKNITQTEILSK